jgi:hypothetical protein
MSKCRSSDEGATNGKKQRKSITLEETLDMIKRHECNKHMVDIGSVLGIPKVTLTTIRKQAEKIKERCKSATRMMVNKITQVRVTVMEKL